LHRLSGGRLPSDEKRKIVVGISGMRTSGTNMWKKKDFTRQKKARGQVEGKKASRGVEEKNELFGVGKNMEDFYRASSRDGS